ncbi:MAG: hypothetical protein JKX70_00760 [Phycisphaerales bacterium]|nr:hypothetical protein [Phycisphaerales bacterium]
MNDDGPDNTTLNQEAGSASDHLRLAAIDHAEYDALADLFLGDGGYAPEPVQALDVAETNDGDIHRDQDAQNCASNDQQEPTHETHTPVLQLARHEDDAPLGSNVPDPDVEHEHFEVQAAGIHVLETLAATDAHASDLLAELMSAELITQGTEMDHGDPTSQLSEQISDARIEFVAMPDPTVEVVVLGHLPVRATLWARQYACNQAKQRCETVALVRAASGSTSVDLITDGESISVRSFDQLDDALAAVSKLADRVILRVDESNEPELLDRPEIEEITILTGADEAAVVASYRLIKTLDATLGEQYIDDEGPTLRVAVMGAGQEMAADACTKLGNAVETFIQRPIEIMIGSGRIDATGTTNLYRDSISHPASHILDGLVHAARVQSDTDDVSEQHVQDSIDSESSAPMVEFPSAGVQIPSPKDIHHEQESKPEQRTEQQPEPKSDQENAPTLRDGLCAMIPGLKPIEARCPKAPGVDLALDSKGRLHLIVCDADSDDAMNRLLAAQTWARNNFGLLIRAEPELCVPTADRDADTDALMHLISIDPRTVREIYDTQVRIYSLARVKVGHVIAQIATPIN